MKYINLPENVVALEERNSKDWTEHNRNISLSVFYKQMEQYPKDTLFYLCAMNKIRKVYKDRIITLPGKDYSSMIDAVADLFIMSQCKRAIFSFESIFSCLAWWLGGCKAKVETVGGRNFFRRKFKKLKNALKQFFN